MAGRERDWGFGQLPPIDAFEEEIADLGPGGKRTMTYEEWLERQQENRGGDATPGLMGGYTGSKSTKTPFGEWSDKQYGPGPWETGLTIGAALTPFPGPGVATKGAFREGSRQRANEVLGKVGADPIPASRTALDMVPFTDSMSQAFQQNIANLDPTGLTAQDVMSGAYKSPDWNAATALPGPTPRSANPPDDWEMVAPHDWNSADANTQFRSTPHLDTARSSDGQRMSITPLTPGQEWEDVMAPGFNTTGLNPVTGRLGPPSFNPVGWEAAAEELAKKEEEAKRAAAQNTSMSNQVFQAIVGLFSPSTTPGVAVQRGQQGEVGGQPVDLRNANFDVTEDGHRSYDNWEDWMDNLSHAVKTGQWGPGAKGWSGPGSGPGPGDPGGGDDVIW